MDDQNREVSLNEVGGKFEEKALPNPMDVPELEAPKKVENPPVIIKKGLLSHPFVATLFLISFFLVSFTLGMYVEKESQASLAQANGVTPQVAQAADQTKGQVLGLEDGSKVTQPIAADERRTKGKPDAKVVIYEFSDYECPFCEAFYTQTYKELVKQYVDTGKVKIVFKDFPLSFHPMAQSAAEASRCAAEQGKFWEMHDTLFENQKSLSLDNYKKWAAGLGLDTQQFNACVDTGKYKQAVIDELNEGIALGVQGTPTFVINGTALVGAQPLSMFQTAMDALLK